ncbi:bifunctional diaminohydroxyphosphoribosylaminopyrimidine deaminase/5-amino-6-(5-phosphoribosylamino)uracil reductase RibD [Acidihalobacter ferrooxydans]|uniref:Riboflavin biosynthesis protein RibD n=1 Tax=Acidihalobacter ferrooxydans TaxID=1765967 RepID=A0A1P8UKX0_9GAMM|nr:bifunctional diaminohydroxyphosphoribosylaminopyrimidine deaminase/5-amino-6-(5-phosphoribosylamino)uracil reductase RibD [Acidihalobacter ferrooxydans]APZ44498.1 riboflavin biosynthesis protein RibD [Acidihalobacter ferrooxydans]
MARALQLARHGLYTTHPNPRVGCVIVRDGARVGEGWHARAGEPHAEIHALRAAGARARGAVAYVTLEPCSHHGRTPPCSDALIEAGVARVVAAMQDPNPQVAGQGLARLAAAGVETACGLMAREARALNPGFISRMERARPWVRVKSAMSLDGRTAMASGESQWITGEAARADVQRWRAQADAVMTGRGTVLADDPSLNVRLSAATLAFEGEVRQPLRVVLDTHLRTSPDARLFAAPGKVLVLCADTSADARRAALQTRGAEVCAVTAHAQGLDLRAVLHALAAREINEVHVEAGATLSGALIAAGLADELVLYIAPSLLGDTGRGLFTLPGLEHLQDRVELELRDVRRVGRDWRIVAGPPPRA